MFFLQNPLNNYNVTKTVKITTRITGNKNVDTYYAKNYAYNLRIIGDDGKPVGSNVAVKVTVNGKVQTSKTKSKTDLNSQKGQNQKISQKTCTKSHIKRRQKSTQKQKK